MSWLNKSNPTRPPLHKNSGPCSHNSDCINSSACIPLIIILAGLTSQDSVTIYLDMSDLVFHWPCDSSQMPFTLSPHIWSTTTPPWTHSNNNNWHRQATSVLFSHNQATLHSSWLPVALMEEQLPLLWKLPYILTSPAMTRMTCPAFGPPNTHRNHRPVQMHS